MAGGYTAKEDKAGGLWSTSVDGNIRGGSRLTLPRSNEILDYYLGCPYEHGTKHGISTSPKLSAPYHPAQQSVDNPEQRPGLQVGFLTVVAGPPVRGIQKLREASARTLWLL